MRILSMSQSHFLHSIGTSLSVAVVIAATAMGQGSANNSGASGSSFLNIGVGARAMGMAGAISTLSDDPTALYWNPAGIAFINDIQISAEHTQWVADIQHSFFGAVVPLTDQFKLGVSVVYLSSGDIEITTIEQPRGTGSSYSVSDVALGTTLGWSVTNSFSIGATMKYIQNSLYTLTATGIGFDVGTRFNTQYHGIVVALAVTNLGTTREYRGEALDFSYPPPYPGAEPIHASYSNVPFSLPLTYRAGVGLELFEFFEMPKEDQKLHLDADLVQPYNSVEVLQLGGEYSYSGMFFVRSGYVFNADELGFNAGVGTRLTIEGFEVKVDYAFSHLKHFDSVNRVGISLGL